MGQTWEDVLFAHWRVSPRALRAHVPPELPLDTFDGTGWLGITPFCLHGLRLHGTPPIPVASSFPELNVRTYVTLEAKPGIWFFSLDAGRRLAVAAARRLYRLPYFHARMRTVRADGAAIEYASDRVARGERPASLRARYGADGPACHASPGSLAYFLTERYCLYTVDNGKTYRGEIHHPPWTLQPAVAQFERNTMPPPGLDLEGDPVLHYASRQDVVIWPLEPVLGVSA